MRFFILPSKSLRQTPGFIHDHLTFIIFIIDLKIMNFLTILVIIVTTLHQSILSFYYLIFFQTNHLIFQVL